MTIYSTTRPERYLNINIASQQLQLIANGHSVARYPVSTAKNGAGQQRGSECTPTGWHRICAKIGDGEPLNAVFIARQFTGEIYSPQLAADHPERDWILTRILWLDGLEDGKNRGGEVDSKSRYIYIHGCPDELMRGVPESHGCVRMRNADVRALFNQVEVEMPVYIHTGDAMTGSHEPTGI